MVVNYPQMFLISLLMQWFDLLKLFWPLSPELRLSCGLASLQLATQRFQEITRSIQDDSRALSLLGKRRGQKGVRELQGDALRHSLEKITSIMVGILAAAVYMLCMYHVPIHNT